MTDALTNQGLSRRSVAKGAAWSVPVLAAAVSVPMASASTEPGVDVAVSADCAGNYDLNNLLVNINNAIRAIRILGLPIGQVVGTLLEPIVEAAQGAVEGLLSALGLQKFESRGFTIQAAEGTIPMGTQFTLTGGGLINVNLLEDLLGGAGVDALGLVSINGDDAIIELTRDLTEGESQHISLQGDAVDLSVGGTVSFGLVGSDNPSEAPGLPNSVSQNFVVVETNLGALGVVDGLLGAIADVPLIGPVLGQITDPIRNALSAVQVTVQLCPGQEPPAGA